jgi:hypothetical protein
MKKIVTVAKNVITMIITKRVRDAIDTLARMSGMRLNKRKFWRQGISSYRGIIIVDACQ